MIAGETVFRSARHPQRGIALITVLLFFAFLSAIAVRLASNHSLLIAGSHNTFGSDLAMNYALGGEEMARQVLYEDFTNSGKESDHLLEAWARALPPLALDEGGAVEIAIRDMNGCFNLNALGGEGAQAAHDVLVYLLNSAGMPPAIADRALDWIDADDMANGLGAEDNEYLLARPAFRTPNGLIGHPTELRMMLSGMDDEQGLLDAWLLRRVCALPVPALQTNVNTASGELLSALLPEVEPGRMEGFVSQPRSYRTVGEFVQAYPEYQAVAGSLRTTSEWFAIDIRVQIDRTTVIMSSLAWRDPATGRVVIKSRDFGQDFRSRVRVRVEDDESDAAKESAGRLS